MTNQNVTQNTEVKLVRLNTGEDVVGNCLFDDESSSLIIESPMKVIVTRLSGSGKAMLVMMPWLPLEIVEENMVSINYDDIITTANPKNAFIEYYFDTIQKYEELIDSVDEESLLDDEGEEDGDDLDIESIEDMINSLQNTKKGTLH